MRQIWVRSCGNEASLTKIGFLNVFVCMCVCASVAFKVLGRVAL